ncbi:hypothetical protein ACFX12_000259 [Malus domestica]
MARLMRVSRTDSWDSGESQMWSMDTNGLTELESWPRHRCEIFVRRRISWAPWSLDGRLCMRRMWEGVRPESTTKNAQHRCNEARLHFYLHLDLLQYVGMFLLNVDLAKSWEQSLHY